MSHVWMEPFWTVYDPPSQRYKPGRWGMTFTGDYRVVQLGYYISLGLRYQLDHVEEAIVVLKDCMAGRRMPGWALGDNDGGVAYGGGYVLFASGYDDQSRVVITADMLLTILERVRDLINHPGFNDPDASFDAMEIPIVATGPEAMDIYYSLGGSTDNP